jgi:hypothetical protein
LGKISPISTQLGKKGKLESRIGLNKPQSIMGFLKSSTRSKKGLLDFEITDELASMKTTQDQSLNVSRFESAAVI